MVSEQLEESLRAEIDSYVERRLSAIRQEIAEVQNQLNEALSQLQEEKGDGQWDGSLAASIAEHLRGAHERGVEMAAAESAKAQASSDMAIIKSAVDEIEGQHSQSEVLKTLVNRASSFAPRVAFFVVKGEEVRGWRGRGFQGSVGDGAIQQITLPLSANTVVSEAAQSRTTWSGNPNSHSDDHLILDRLGDQLPPQRVVAVPLVVRDRTVAVLYADSAELDSEAINLEAVETLVRVTGMAVELLSVAQVAAATPAPEPARVEPEVKPAEVNAGYTPEREYEPEPRVEAAAPAYLSTVEASLPETQPITEPVAVQETATPAEAEADSFAETMSGTEPAGETEPIRYSEPVLESEPSPAPEVSPVPVVTPETSFADLSGETEPITTAAETASAPVGARRRYGSYDSALPVEVTDEEEKRQHNDARRFARLLVSEIKLYNEQKVIDGRSQSDLYERLREYIDRSREMYDKRVKPVVAERYDYFHHELVDTLAEGDAGKLGEAYPGTTVPA